MNNGKINVYLTFVFICIFIPPRRRRRRRRNEEERKSAAEAHRLITVREPAHTAHHTQDIVRNREDFDVVGGGDTLEVEGGVVDAGHIARATGLMLLGLEREGVHRNVASGDTLVVLVRLDELVVGGLAGGGPVVTVELEMGLFVGSGVFANLGIGLLNPDELLDGVVEVELDLGLGLLVTGELRLGDEVLVGDLRKSAPFIGIEVDVVNVEGGGVERCRGGAGGDAVGEGREFDVHLHLVVLQRDERQCEARVGAEPELEGNVESPGNAGILASGEGGVLGAGNHGFVTVPVTGGLGELIPDVEPVAVLFVNALPANFDLNGFDEAMTDPGVVGVATGESRERHLDVHTGDKVTVSGDGAGDLLAEVGRPVEGLVDRFARKVRVPAVDHLEESDLGVTAEVDVLRAVGYELHKSATHRVCFNYT